MVISRTHKRVLSETQLRIPRGSQDGSIAQLNELALFELLGWGAFAMLHSFFLSFVLYFVMVFWLFLGQLHA